MRRRSRRSRASALASLAVVGGLLAVVGNQPTAQAAQAPGDDVPAWAPGWNWTYGTTFNYSATGTNVTINENVTMTNAGVTTFNGQKAYRLNLTGTISGGSGTVAVDGVGNATLSNFAGNVTGVRYVRQSDLALLQEQQQQHLTAKAQVSIISQNITADINLSLDPDHGWETHAFPLNVGDTWQNDVDVDYDGGFNYDAGSIGGSGAAPFVGTFNFDSPSTVSSENVTIGSTSVATKKMVAASSDGTTSDTIWFSAAHKADVKEQLKLPLDDGGSLSLTRTLTSASTPAPSASLSTTITPSLSCAGGPVTVSGQLSSGAAGAPVSVSLDRSAVSPGAATTVNTTTTAGGNYTATLTAPSDADGIAKNGARGTWGVVTTSGAANGAATLVVTPQACSSLAYTGDVAAEQGNSATVSAKLTDLSGAGQVNGRTITFAISGGGSVNAVTNATGVATATLPIAAPARSATITASFAGNAQIAASSATAPFNVAKVSTTTAVIADPAVATIGDPVTFTAEVNPSHGAAATGQVQFRVDGADFGSPVSLSGGSATSAPISTLAIGYHAVSAIYLGTADHAGSTSPTFTFRVRQPLVATTTSLTTSKTSAVYGESVTLSAHVTGAGNAATGAVIFKSGATVLGSAGVDANGDAVLDSDDLPVGNLAVVATYEGDDTYGPSTSAQRNVTVTKAQVEVTLNASDTTTVSGESVTYSATVAVQAPGGGVPGGTVKLFIDGNQAGAPVALQGGAATFPAVTTLGAGQHVVRVAYEGTSTHGAGEDSLDQLVTAADTTVAAIVSPTPANEGQSATVTVSVAAVAPGGGSPTGSVSFTDNGQDIGAAPLTGSGSGSTATFDVSDLEPGTHVIVASYDGDADYHASESAPLNHSVIAAAAIVRTTTTVTSSANPSSYGQIISFTAHVVAADDSAPPGAVQFSLDGVEFGDPVPVEADGTAESLSLGSPDPGSHTVIATYTAGSGYSGSGDLLVQDVDAAVADLTLTTSQQDSTAGHAVKFTANVTNDTPGVEDPTGHVQFMVDGVPLGGAVEIDGAGKAVSQQISSLTPGSHQVVALYSGNVHFDARSTSIEQRVKVIATTTSLSASAASTTFGQAVTFTATVTPADNVLGSPVGTVQFVDGTTVLATLPLAPAGNNGTASLTTSSFNAGNHSVKAVYSGGNGFGASTSAAKAVAVGKVATSIAADAAVVKLIPLGLPLGMLRSTLKAGGAPLAGVPLEFKVGPKVVCTSTTDATGMATCNAFAYLLPLTLNLGYTVSYAGDADHAPSSAKGAIIK